MTANAPRITAVMGNRRVDAARSVRAANAMLARLSECMTQDQMADWLARDGSHSLEWAALGIADQTAVCVAYERRCKLLKVKAA